VGENAGAFAGGFERADDVEEVGVVALFGGGSAEGLEALVGIVERVDAGGPAFVAEGGIGDDVIEGFEGVAIEEFGIGEGVALEDEGAGVVVQDHVHAGEAAGGGVLSWP